MTPDEIKEFFSYSANGDFLWIKKQHGRGCNVGEVAGTINNRVHTPYRVITLKQKKFYAHRLIWILHNGEIPSGMCIDHIDGNGLNNKIENLRLVSLSENQRNRRINRNNRTGEIGIFHHKNGFSVTAAEKYIGWFKSLSEAVKARNESHKKMGFHENHGRLL